MKTLQDYLDLIPAANRNQPVFISTLTVDVEPSLTVQTVLAEMIPKFDLDLATGKQLDILGEWAGISRDVSIPITGIYFSWNTTAAVGWNNGFWQPPLAPSSITVLPDDAYRTLIRAKIAANKWDGTTDGAYAIWDALLPDVTVLIQDNQNMTYDLAIVGGSVDTLTQALITGGYIPLKPEGVRVTTYFIPIDSGPLFGFDVENDFVKGFDEGSWAQEIAPT